MVVANNGRFYTDKWNTGSGTLVEVKLFIRLTMNTAYISISAVWCTKRDSRTAVDVGPVAVLQPEPPPRSPDVRRTVDKEGRSGRCRRADRALAMSYMINHVPNFRTKRTILNCMNEININLIYTIFYILRYYPMIYSIYSH